MCKRALIFGLFIVTFLGSRIAAVRADDTLPPQVLIKVLMTVLTYDKNLHKHRSPTIRIGVISPSGNANGKKRAAETLDAFGSFSGKKVKGLPFEVERVDVTSDQDVKKTLGAGRYNMLFICKDSVQDAASIGKLANEKKILTLTGCGEYVQAGLSIGAVLRSGKPKILINLSASKEQGASLDARLLNLAEVIR